jgi:hypothetical protein
MTQITIEEAATRARREFLPFKGVVAVSHVGNTIIVYVENAEVARLLPKAYFGFPVAFKLTGPIVTMR